jgi:MFS transporter, MHS family, shikimate and dehydroshikimate transport protein
VLASFGTAAVGFVARPVSGAFFGNLGDRLGLQPSLVIVLRIVGVAALLIGLISTLDTIGVWAAIGLFVLRLCRALATGGQWGGAMLLATEYAPANRRGLFGSFVWMGVLIGLILGNVFLVLTAVLTRSSS